MSQACHNLSIEVNWLKTVVAWLAATAVMMGFGVLVPTDFNLDGFAEVFYALTVWLAATTMMFVTQYALHSLGCIGLSHFLLVYPIAVSPILLNGFIEGAFEWTKKV